MQVSAGLVMGSGIALGGWRVIRTVGTKITRLEPASGFVANMAAAGVIEAASTVGLPVSTTHTASSSIMGVGSTRGLNAVSLTVVRGIFGAWLVTYPFCFGLGWVVSELLDVLV